MSVLYLKEQGAIVQKSGDRIIVNKKGQTLLDMYDFEDGEDKRVVLNEEGYRKFCYEYERWMTGRNRTSGESSFRACMRKQVAAFRRSIQKNEPYQTYTMPSGEMEEVI